MRLATVLAFLAVHWSVAMAQAPDSLDLLTTIAANGYSPSAVVMLDSVVTYAAHDSIVVTLDFSKSPSAIVDTDTLHGEIRRLVVTRGQLHAFTENTAHVFDIATDGSIVVVGAFRPHAPSFFRIADAIAYHDSLLIVASYDADFESSLYLYVVDRARMPRIVDSVFDGRQYTDLGTCGSFIIAFGKYLDSHTASALQIVGDSALVNYGHWWPVSGRYTTHGSSDSLLVIATYVNEQIEVAAFRPTSDDMVPVGVATRIELPHSQFYAMSLFVSDSTYYVLGKRCYTDWNAYTTTMLTVVVSSAGHRVADVLALGMNRARLAGPSLRRTTLSGGGPYITTLTSDGLVRFHKSQGHNLAVNDVYVTRENALATARHDDTWYLHTSAGVHACRIGDDGTVARLGFTPMLADNIVALDDSRLAALDTSIRIVNVSNPNDMRVVSTYAFGHSATVSNLSSNGDLAVAAAFDSGAVVLRIAQDASVVVGRIDKVTTDAVVVKDHVVVAARDGTITSWSVTGREALQLDHTLTIDHGVATTLSADDSAIAAGIRSRVFLIDDRRSELEVRDSQHANSVPYVTVYIEGQRILSKDSDRQLREWATGSDGRLFNSGVHYPFVSEFVEGTNGGLSANDRLCVVPLSVLGFDIVRLTKPAGVTDQLEPLRLHAVVYPNPAASTITVNGPIADAQISICIINVRGEVIQCDEGVESLPHSISVSGLTAGTYMLCVTTAAGQSHIPFVIAR